MKHRKHAPEPIYPNDENPLESDFWPFTPLVERFKNKVNRDLFACFVVALAISAIIISGFIRLVTL